MTASSVKYAVQVEFVADMAISQGSELSVSITGHVDTSGVNEDVEIFDFVSASYKQVSYQPASNGTDVTTTVVLKDDPAQYITSSGKALVRVTYYGSTTGWHAFFDQVRWDVLPY